MAAVLLVVLFVSAVGWGVPLSAQAGRVADPGRGAGQDASSRAPNPVARAPLPQCLGETRSLILSRGMPYVPVRLAGRSGFFVLDLGSDGSALSPATLLGGASEPAPLPAADGSYGPLDFFDPDLRVRLALQNHSGIEGLVPQGGLIGTDLLRDHVFTIDYGRALLQRASRGQFCSDAQLRSAGYSPLPSGGYFGSDPAALRCPAAPRSRPCPNIPTIPVRIGTVVAVAQVDSGFDDSLRPWSLNINTALLERLLATGLPLRRWQAADLRLSTCAGVDEAVQAWRLPPRTALEWLDQEGAVARRLEGVTLFVKRPPPEARRCGGIGSWDQPAAQLGASFLAGGSVSVDPFTARLWWRPATWFRS